MVYRYPDSGSQDELDLDIRILSDNLTITGFGVCFAASDLLHSWKYSFRISRALCIDGA